MGTEQADHRDQILLLDQLGVGALKIRQVDRGRRETGQVPRSLLVHLGLGIARAKEKQRQRHGPGRKGGGGGAMRHQTSRKTDGIGLGCLYTNTVPNRLRTSTIVFGDTTCN